MNIKTLFLDIGGVLLTNGWDRKAREQAASYFQIDLQQLNERHQLSFPTYEIGHLTLDEYLQQAVFHRPRDFSMADFQKFMFAQSQPLQPMIDLVRALKEKYQLQTVAISNEGRELTDYRIRQFNLREFIDFFVVSGYVRLKKPDPAIYGLALSLSQADPAAALYIDDRLLFVEVAATFGIRGIHHQDAKTTAIALNSASV